MKQTGEVIEINKFYNHISQWASQHKQCAVAKIAKVPNASRIYNTDGSRVAKELGGLSNTQLEEVIEQSGLTGCKRFSCEK